MYTMWSGAEAPSTAAAASGGCGKTANLRRGKGGHDGALEGVAVSGVHVREGAGGRLRQDPESIGVTLCGFDLRGATEFSLDRGDNPWCRLSISSTVSPTTTRP
jgi:hypothetical protein